ncbi:MAG: SRPBCC family protein [Deltaproteobacteria bacterium]|nr:SRPBCC family protein [Deltaproteobacteria bacterium]
MILFAVVVAVVAAAPVEAPEVIEVAEGVTPGWRATFDVHAEANDVLDVVVDQPRYSKTLFSGVKSLKVLTPPAAGTWQMEYTTDGAMSFTYVSKNVLKKSPDGGGTLSWSRLSGDFDVVEGSWVITPLSEPGWSHVVYTVRVAMGPGFMQGFLRDGIKDSTTGIAGRLRAVMARLPKKPSP